MRKYTYFLLGLIMVVSSCQYKVDNSNPFKVAEAIHEGLSQRDSTILKEIFVYEMDSLNNYSRESLKKAQDFFNENKRLKIIKIDTTTSNISSFFGQKDIQVFYKKDKDFYRIYVAYEPDSTKKIKPKTFNFDNLNERCEEDKNTPYNPSWGIEFKNLTWNTDYSGQTFKYGAVFLQNNLGEDLDYIKFRVILKRGLYSWSAETFLNQTVESYNQIYDGDIVKIDVPGMSNYFTGFKINREELFFNAEIIEVQPKPESYWCTKLIELENKK